jgi:hypothetical protein
MGFAIRMRCVRMLCMIYKVYPGIWKKLLLVKCVSETNNIFMFWLKIKILISCEYLTIPLAFQIVILSVLSSYIILVVTKIIRTLIPFLNVDSMSSFIIYFNSCISFVSCCPELGGIIWRSWIAWLLSCDYNVESFWLSKSSLFIRRFRL